MRVLWIVLASIAAVIILILLLFFLGKAKIRVRYRDKLRVTLTVLCFRFPIIPSKDERKLRTPGARRRAEKRAMKKRKRDAERRKRKEGEYGDVKPTVAEILPMIFSMVRGTYERLRGNLTIDVRRFRIRVATGDAAKTALLYGATVSTASCMMQYIHTHFNTIDRNSGDMSIEPDYLSFSTTAEIDIEFGMNLFHALPAYMDLIALYRDEKARADEKARLRMEKAAQKARADQLR